MEDPQSLHKYAYVHGDPIQGIDPTGLRFSAGQTLAGISISTVVGGISTSAIFYAADRDPLYGLFVGLGGGFGLGKAFFLGKPGEFARVVGESALAAALVVVSEVLRDKIVGGVVANQNELIDYVAEGTEAFMWAAYLTSFGGVPTENPNLHNPASAAAANYAIFKKMESYLQLGLGLGALATNTGGAFDGCRNPGRHGCRAQLL